VPLTRNEELEVSACKRLDFKPGTSTTVRADSDAQGLPQLEAGGVGSLSMTASVCQNRVVRRRPSRWQPQRRHWQITPRPTAPYTAGATAVICARHLLPAARVAPEGDSLSRAPILTVADSEAGAPSLGTASLQISAEGQPAERARVAASMQAAPTLHYLALARANQARASQSLVKASVC
jgi:hypothetical protein